MKIELLIPTKQFANIKFFIEAKDEKELDEKITRLWRKYFNYFESIDLKSNLDKLDKKQKHKIDYIEDLEEDNEDNRVELRDLITNSKYASSDGDSNQPEE